MELASRGARVTLMARSLADCEVNAEAARRLGAEAQAVECDVTSRESIDRAFEQARGELGRVDILVNNAGAAEGMKAAAMTRELWDRMIALNLTATFECTTIVLGEMLEGRWGRIVNISSTAGLRGYKTMGAYCAAKHGVIGYTRAVALETARHGVTVNAVCPGYTETNLVEESVENLTRVFEKSPEEVRAMLMRTIPRGRLTSPEEVAAAVAWLCLPTSGAVTGIALPVAGGEV
jgi:NAD(P)-dependent dehydrogenase (short-subunit alcohol dehydrogenase family)